VPGVVEGIAVAARLGSLDPRAFTAATVNVYVVPFVRPLMVVDVPVGDVPEHPPHDGSTSTVYPVIKLPPLLGAAQLRSTVPLPVDATLNAVGTSGIVDAFPLTGVLGVPDPCAFSACTEMLYVVPFVRPLIVVDVPTTFKPIHATQVGDSTTT
jgi:hypothetical protein